MSEHLLRVYFDPVEIGADGYPFVWHGSKSWPGRSDDVPAIKDLIREQAGHRCERCGHPYKKGMGEWSPCDEQCTHGGPMRWTDNFGNKYDGEHFTYAEGMEYGPGPVEAQWRILTVHHLNGVKHDCRWWNLAALCQRCHLTIQAKVHLARTYDRPHTEWFRPHAAGYYTSEYQPEPSRAWVIEHMDEILDEHAVQGTLL